MKKSFLYIVGLIALMAVSCTDESIVEQSGNELRITGSVASDSRTTFVEGEGVIETHWNAGDGIGLFTEKQTNLFYNALENGKSTEFSKGENPWNYYEEELIPEENKTVYACYPYHYLSKGIDSVALPRTSSRIPFLYAQSSISNGELNFQFKHLYAYLKIVISTEEIKERFKLAETEYGPLTMNGGFIAISSTENIGVMGDDYNYYNLKTNEIYGTHDLTFEKSTQFLYDQLMDMSIDSTYTFILPILPQPEGTNIQASISANKVSPEGFSSESVSLHFTEKRVPQGGLQAGHVYTWDIAKPFKYEKNVALLKSFYEKTQGNQWHHNDNWTSDKPISQWYGINKEYAISNNIETLSLYYNGLTGPFPEEVAEIMDNIIFRKSNYYYDFNLNSNNLYGPIPDAVKNHKRWNELGWMCVVQNITGDKELDLTNSNLYIENVRVEDLFEDESTVQYLYDIFKQNKLTQITGCDFYGHKMHINEVLENFTDKRVNLHLDYQSKGLQTLYFLGEGTEEEENECRKNLYSVYKDVDGITWLKGNNNNTHQYRSSSYFYDSNGQLVYIAEHNPTCPWSEENLLIEKTDKFLRSVLGEPVEHPEFSAEIYTSTDYSRDGEVVTLQEATVGQGINLVFLGEAYVDKDMEPGGLYEQTMKEAMEQFFSYEPYKSFRNRFNVYAVKAVSPNSVYLEGTKQAINEDNTVCFNYAQKIPNAEKNPPMVTVIYRDFIWDPIYMGRSHTFMGDDGSFVAYIYDGINDASVLMHETGGHGFGGLLDEYVEPGNEDLTLPEDRKNSLENRWTNFGIGANVDWRSDASTVKWSHFLNDSRYTNESLGLYEGAYLYGYGAYRPTEHSMMRYNNCPFNAPSREAIYKRIMQRSEGNSWTYDYEEFVKYDAINRNAASRSTSRTLTEAEKQEYIKNHQPPTFINGTWRDAMKNGKNKIVVPLR